LSGVRQLRRSRTNKRVDEMKILMLLSNPFMVDPRVYNEAKCLTDAGHKVTVIIWDRKQDYKLEDFVEGIHIIAIHNSSIMKLMPNDLFRNPFWWWHAFKKGVDIYKSGLDFDVVHCHDLDTLVAGVLLKQKFGIKLVYDAHEIFGYMIESTMPKFISKIAFLMEKKLVGHVDKLITVNQPLLEYFSSFYKGDITIVMNCKNLVSNEYVPAHNDEFTLSYIGVLSKARMFPELIDIVGQINGVRFVIAGKKENLYEKVREICKKYDNVEFLGTIPYDDAIKKTLESNAIICMFDPSIEIHKIGLPNKIFEAMALARPIIVTKNMYYSNEFVEKEKFGLSISYDSKDIINAIIKLRDNSKLCEELGKNGLIAAKKKYNWGKQKAKLLKVYEEIK
jgi:glycosyltransferase involved in cell wall biosynthesis